MLCNRRSLSRLFSLSAAVGVLLPSVAFAQATTVGEVMGNAHNNFTQLLPATSAASYVAACGMVIQLLVKLKEYAEAPGQRVKAFGLLMRSIGIAALFALPSVLALLQGAFSMGSGLSISETVTSASGEGLDAALVHMVTDIVPALTAVIGLVAFLSGLFLIISGIVAMSNYQYAEDKVGKRGIIVRLGIGTALTSFGPAVGTMLGTVFGTTSGTAIGTLAYSQAGLDATSGAQVNNVFNAIFAWLSVIGLMAILRGLWVLYGSLEGNKGPGSLMAPMTHLIAGAALVNIVPAIQLVEKTLGCGSGSACQILNG